MPAVRAKEPFTPTLRVAALCVAARQTVIQCISMVAFSKNNRSVFTSLAQQRAAQRMSERTQTVLSLEQTFQAFNAFCCSELVRVYKIITEMAHRPPMPADKVALFPFINVLLVWEGIFMTRFTLPDHKVSSLQYHVNDPTNKSIEIGPSSVQCGLALKAKYLQRTSISCR